MLFLAALLASMAPTNELLPEPRQFTPMDDKLSEPPPENKQSWAHPVIFEPQPKIRLTRSSYQVSQLNK